MLCGQFVFLILVAGVTDVRDINLELASRLYDMAVVAGDSQRAWGYTRAAKAVLRIDRDITPLVTANTFKAIAGIGPTTDRIARELIHDGTSAFVERAVSQSGKEDEVARLRGFRRQFLSRAAVREILSRKGTPSREKYRGDFQMHSIWSDGAETLESIVTACLERGWSCAGMTDHSYGLSIAGGMTMEQVAWTAIALLAAALISTIFYLGNKIDTGVAAVNARIDALGARVDARIDAFGGQLQAHIEHHPS